MNVLVVGSGGWGTALAFVLHKNGHAVPLRARSTETLAIVAGWDCVEGADVVVLSTPSFGVREAARAIAPRLAKGAVVVSTSKGIEKGTSLRFSQVIAQEIGESHPVVVLSGPSHAEEVSQGLPTAVVSASLQREAAELVQDLFLNPGFRVYASDDVVGVEIGGAMKNVIALCAGVCDGMGYQDNTKAALMTRGLTEIARLVVAMGGKSETVAGLTGVGDLIVTCTSMHSRNRRMGILIGQGKTVDEAIQAAGGVAEGYYAAETAYMLATDLGIEMPIAQGAYEVLYRNREAQSLPMELMGRAKRHELESSWI